MEMVDWLSSRNGSESAVSVVPSTNGCDSPVDSAVEVEAEACLVKRLPRIVGLSELESALAGS